MESVIRKVKWIGVVLSVMLVASLFGATVQAADQDYARPGALIIAVTPDSPAVDAGLVRGDIIQEVDGEKVDGSDAFIEKVMGAEASATLTLSVLHGDDVLDISVTLGDLEGRPFVGVYLAADITAERLVATAEAAKDADDAEMDAADEGDADDADEADDAEMDATEESDAVEADEADEAQMDATNEADADKADDADADEADDADADEADEADADEADEAEMDATDESDAVEADEADDAEMEAADEGDADDADEADDAEMEAADEGDADDADADEADEAELEAVDEADGDDADAESMAIEDTSPAVMLEETENAALIVSVANFGPAFEVGLQAGDVLLGIDGERFVSIDDLTQLADNYEPGDDIVLEVLHMDGSLEAIEMTLTEHPRDSELPFIGIRYVATPYSMFSEFESEADSD